MKKIKEEDVIEGYKIGNLVITIQGVPDAKTGRIIKGVFCTLKIKDSEDKEEKINFVFSLNSVPSFRKHILSMINEVISQKIKSKKVVKK